VRRVRTIAWTGVLICALQFGGCRRQDPNAVAEVPGRVITSDEFRERYRAYLSSTSSRDNILLRKKILENMINEALIFDDLHRNGMDSDSSAVARLTQVNNEALLMGYARHISLDTMTVTEKELQDEFRRSRSKVRAHYLYAKSEEDAWRLKEMVERGSTFESLARDVFQDPGLANNGGDLGYFGWGEMEPALEDVAFSLSVGSVSDPVKMKIGYAIVRVDDRVEAPLASENDYAAAKEKLLKSVRRRMVLSLLTTAASQIGQELAPVFNELAVAALYARTRSDSNGASRRLLPEEAAASDTLATRPFMTFKGGSWNVGEFIRKMAQTTERERRRVKSVEDLKTVAAGLATREILLDRARSSDLMHDSDVIRQVKRVGDEYFLRRWASSVQDTVGSHGWNEDELKAYFREHRDQYALPPEINVGEILVRTEREARTVLKQIQRGMKFSELAKAKSIRLWAAKRGGELGFGTKSSYGILGEKFFKAKAGDLIGPERVDPYYGVFKIFATRGGRPMTFDEARDRVIKSLTFVRKQEVFQRAVAHIRSRGEITVHEDVLATIVVN
jgi:parvulin-like peptidyl-prolyl isomerase